MAPPIKNNSNTPKKILSRVFHVLARLFLGLKAIDTQTEAKVFWRKVPKDVADHMISEMRLRCKATKAWA